MPTAKSENQNASLIPSQYALMVSTTGRLITPSTEILDDK
jgi:hypothetical protein